MRAKQRSIIFPVRLLPGLSDFLEQMEQVNLENDAKKKVKAYSGGMKRRLGIAQTILNHPGLIVLDEPTAGLDPKERVRFRHIFEQLGNDLEAFYLDVFEGEEQ